jgi:hypothetical protein
VDEIAGRLFIVMENQGQSPISERCQGVAG